MEKFQALTALEAKRAERRAREEGYFIPAQEDRKRLKELEKEYALSFYKNPEGDPAIKEAMDTLKGNIEAYEDRLNDPEPYSEMKYLVEPTLAELRAEAEEVKAKSNDIFRRRDEAIEEYNEKMKALAREGLDLSDEFEILKNRADVAIRKISQPEHEKTLSNIKPHTPNVGHFKIIHDNHRFNSVSFRSIV